MALTSPGVQVSVIDESQYLAGAPASVPFFLFATAENKADPTSTATAAATTAANAGKLYTITSQRDLVTLYGNPFFYSSSDAGSATFSIGAATGANFCPRGASGRKIT